MTTNVGPLLHYLKPITKILNQDGITEVMINQPGEAFIEKFGDMEHAYIPEYDYKYLEHLTKLIGNYTKQWVDKKTPLLSAILPEGERVQIVVPPACEQGKIVYSIRKPSILDFTLEDYEKQGAFENVIFDQKDISDEDKHLMELKENWQTKEFIKYSVRYKKNIIFSGGTTTGKTTFLNAVVKEIPLDERILTIEDVQESKPPHKNKVHLLYSKGGQGTSSVTASDLLEVCLRLRPDRIIPSEIRGSEAFNFLETINSGHPGSMTSLHANSSRHAVNRLVFMCLRARTGLTKPEIVDYIGNVVDVIIQLKRVKGRRFISEILYEPKMAKAG